MATDILDRVRQLLVPPDDPKAIAALVAHKAGNNAEAVQLIDEAIAANPEPAFSWAVRGDALAALGRREEAAASFERAVERASGTEDDRLFLALTLYSNQREVAAEARRAGLKWAEAAFLVAETVSEPKTGGARAKWTPPPRSREPSPAPPSVAPSIAPRVALGLAIAIPAILLIWRGCSAG